MGSSPPSIRTGELLAGKYRVDRVIGEGGMGIVLAATNEALAQKVAIKLLRKGALDDAEALGRFEREARAAASLRSEHVARVRDVGKLEDGRPYMVLELLEGRDLGDLIEKAPPLTIAEAVDYVLQACEAIAEAHGAGIIHRDLKPKNLFLTTTVHGRPLVKVLDFGISKVDDPAQEMQLTRTTEVIGSPSYMSPEQLRSARNVDTRTDIWALGVILYELLTRRLPFYAHTVTELVAVVLLEREPPVHAVRPDVPEMLSLVVGRCLAKRPEDRFASVADLAHALEPFAQKGADSAAARVRNIALQSNRSLPPTTNGPPQMSAATAPMGVALGPQGSGSGPHGAYGSGPHGAQAGSGRVGSGPAPSGGSSSSRVAVHGGTSVAWGETQMDAPRSKQRRATGIAVVLSLGLLSASGAAIGAVWYVKHSTALPTNAPSAPTDPMPLPLGRKDLPPLNAPSTDTASVPVPTALPDTRGGVRPLPVASASASGASPGAARPHGLPPPPPPHGDDLSNIGRR